MKEDKNTSAGAYHSGSYIAAGGGSFESFWLRGQLHEINHGYQPNYNSIGIYTGEFSNILYNIHYLKHYYGINIIEKDWLFNYGKKEASDNQVETQLNNGIHYSSLGYSHRLALILLTAELSYTDKGLSNDTTYDYTVKAVSNDYQQSEESNKISVKTDAAITEEYRVFKLGTLSKPEQYTVKEIVSYNGSLYETIVTHKNYGNTDWAPDKAPTLLKLYKK